MKKYLQGESGIRNRVRELGVRNRNRGWANGNANKPGLQSPNTTRRIEAKRIETQSMINERAVRGQGGGPGAAERLPLGGI